MQGCGGLARFTVSKPSFIISRAKLVNLFVSTCLGCTPLVSVHPCDTEKNGGCEGICMKKGPTVQCACKKPFKLGEDKMSCIKVHPCEEKNGGCEQTCKRKGNEAYCVCKKGYELSEDGKSCESVHPCDVDNGGCSHKCTKVGLKAVCVCKEDHLLEEDGKTCERGK